MAEYTSELQEIVKALNHQATPTWLIAVVSSLLGFLAALLVQVFQHWYIEHRERSKMRKIIYSELGAMYSMLVYLQPKMVSGPEEEDFTYAREKLRQRFLRAEGEEYSKKFEGEKYAEDHKDVFIQLQERSRIIGLYSIMRDAFSDDEFYGFLILSGLAMEIVEDSVRFDWLPRKFVKRHMSAVDAAAIDLAIKRRIKSGHAGSDAEISANPYERDPYE